MLESDELSVRFAGIYALRELVTSDPDDTYIMVLDLLFDFVRARSKERKRTLDPVVFKKQFRRRNVIPATEVETFTPFPPDLLRALETASWLRCQIDLAKSYETTASWQPNLLGANLAHAEIGKINLSNTLFGNAKLSSHTSIKPI